MKLLFFLLLFTIFLSCELNESYNFAYRIETDEETTSRVTYYHNGVYEEETITTPWQSETIISGDDSISFYIRITYSSSNGRFFILRDGAIWKTQSFYSGYQLEFKEFLND